jgi:antitoxin VapB
MMAMRIKNEATERLARQVARVAGESITEAIQKSLEERLGRLNQLHKAHMLTHQIEDLLQRVDPLPTLDSRPEKEILGYDKDGIPR